MKRDTLNDILQEFTCRICLFRHKENSEISGTLSTFAEYISKHLDFEVICFSYFHPLPLLSFIKKCSNDC